MAIRIQNPIRIIATQGDSFKRSITIRDDATGLGRDLTGVIITGGVRADVDKTVNLLNFSVVNRDDANGTFDIRLNSTEMASLAVDGHSDSYYFDLKVNAGGSPPNIETKLYGTFLVRN